MTHERGLPFADSKAFVLATNRPLAARVAHTIGVSKDCIVDNVKRLGLDHPLSAKGRTARPVIHGRIGQNMMRLRLVKKHRRQGGGARVFQTGVIPSAVYGAECSEEDCRQVGVLRRAAGAVGRMGPAS